MTQLADAHIEGQRRLRAAAAAAVGAAWERLATYDEDQVPAFTAVAGGITLAAQRQAAALTNAFLARAVGRQPLAVDLAELTGAGVRNGTPPSEVYRRPFVTVWTALAADTPYEQAVAAGLARATSTAATDVQLTMRATLVIVGDRDDRILGYERVADPGACDFCLAVNGAKLRTADPMPLHNGCGCGVDVITEPFEPTSAPDEAAVHEHGELGPVLADPAHDFTQL